MLLHIPTEYAYSGSIPVGGNGIGIGCELIPIPPHIPPFIPRWKKALSMAQKAMKLLESCSETINQYTKPAVQMVTENQAAHDPSEAVTTKPGLNNL